MVSCSEPHVREYSWDFNYDEDRLDSIVEHELIEGSFDCLLEASAVRFLCF